MERTFGVIGSLFGFLAVAFGAFGAHALRERLPPGELEIFETAVRYQMYHALALLLLAFLLGRQADEVAVSGGFGVWAGWAFTLGIAVFSGSLYLLVLTGARWMGAITPIGGVALLVGWALLGVRFWRGG